MLKLLQNALTKFFLGFLIVSVLLFLPAGTLLFPNAWLFIGLLFIPMLILGIFLYIKAPALLKKRLNANEKEKSQKRVVAFSALIFLAGFIVAGIDFRYQWSKIPIWVVCASSVTLLLSYALYAEVMRENMYLSRTVEVQEGQKVIDSGLYGIIRHPMYSSTILIFLSIPLVLGSYVSFLVFLPYIFIVVIRILNEETVLDQNLPGYLEYKKKVKFRLIPYIW